MPHERQAKCGERNAGWLDLGGRSRWPFYRELAHLFSCVVMTYFYRQVAVQNRGTEMGLPMVDPILCGRMLSPIPYTCSSVEKGSGRLQTRTNRLIKNIRMASLLSTYTQTQILLNINRLDPLWRHWTWDSEGLKRLNPNLSVKRETFQKQTPLSYAYLLWS